MILKVPQKWIVLVNKNYIRYYYNMPFKDFYERTTGQSIEVNILTKLKQLHPKIDIVNSEDIKYSLQILKKFGISKMDACKNPHILTMNPIIMDNYGEILKECGFINLIPMYIIRYHTTVRSKTIHQLKEECLIEKFNDLEERLLSLFPEWPMTHKIITKSSETTSSILNVRMKILQLYLNWRLDVSEDEFKKYCAKYAPLKHRPMKDYQKAIDIAQNELNIEPAVIRKNGFLISAEPVNSKLIIDNIHSLAGCDLKEIIRREPAILRNNYKSLQQIQNILEEFNISQEAQMKNPKIYCLSPKAVKARLEELSQIKEFKMFTGHPRILSLVLYKSKMLSRLDNLYSSKKHNYSLNRLVSQSIIFENYVNKLGDKTCSRDMAIIILSSLNITSSADCDKNNKKSAKYKSNKITKYILKELKKHKYYLHVALTVVDNNIKMLKHHFNADVIIQNCQLLMYPLSDIKHYLDNFLKLRTETCEDLQLEGVYNNLNYAKITDSQILSLVLYELEKKHHFTGDGIWCKSELVRCQK